MRSRFQPQRAAPEVKPGKSFRQPRDGSGRIDRPAVQQRPDRLPVFPQREPDGFKRLPDRKPVRAVPERRTAEIRPAAPDRPARKHRTAAPRQNEFRHRAVPLQPEKPFAGSIGQVEHRHGAVFILPDQEIRRRSSGGTLHRQPARQEPVEKRNRFVHR